MKFLSLAFGLAAALVVQSQPSDPSGTWKAVFVGPTADRPTMVSEMTFEFTVNGNELTGMAHMGIWPGDAPISEAVIDGNKVSFTVNGRLPWSGTGRNTSVVGYPKLKFVGTVQGDEMKLSLNWGGVDTGVVDGKQITDLERRGERELPMEAKRVSR